MIQKSESSDILSAEDKRLLNMLEIKMYDISQNVEIIGKQLTNNQIKDVIATTYHIFAQLKRIFEHAGMKDVFEVVKKMQVNSVALATILTERIDKKIEPVKTKMQEVQPQPQVKHHVIEPQAPTERKTRHSKLGGICLYNQSYMRGLQYYQVDTESLEQVSGKCRIKQSKRSKDEFLSSISRELDSKAEVEVETIADEIKKYINDYKENSKINSCVSYEKELVEIIDFFKVSELQAMSFLNKSPKNQEYTEDYINRLNDLENQFKIKEKAGKMSINEKLRFFIINLKVKLHDMEQKYQDKNLKLQQFQQSLKKVTACMSTQTYDGYQSRLKSQEMTIKELEDRYKILSQLKSKEINFESKYYEIYHDLNLKNTEINKMKTVNIELESEIEYLKKIIRENKDKFSFDIKDFEKKRKNKKIGKEASKKQIEDHNQQRANRQLSDTTGFERRSSKAERKTKRLQRVQTSSIFKPSQMAEIAKESQVERFPQPEGEAKFILTKQQSVQAKPSTFKPQPKAVLTTPNSAKEAKEGQTKESVFKSQYKKNTKKSEEERQVSFLQQASRKIINQISLEGSSCEITPANLSIDNIRNGQECDIDQTSQKTSKKNTLRQIITSAKSSMRSLQGQSKKSSKIVSKKCIILKDNKEKEKNLLHTTIKMEQLTIREVMKLTIFPQQQPLVRERQERPSYPFANGQTLNSGTSIKSNTKLHQISADTSKSKLNYQSTYNAHRVKSIEGKSKNGVLDSLKKKDNQTIKKGTSKKQNLLDYSSSKHYLQIQSEKAQIQGNLRKIDRNQLQRNHNSFQSQHNKEAASYLQSINEKNRDVSICDKITEENWRNPSYENSQASSLANYILEEITKEQLNVEEFKEIIKCIGEDAHHSQGISVAYDVSPKRIQQFGINNESLDQVIHSKRYSKLKEKRETKDIGKQIKDIFKVKKEQIYGVGQRAYLHIREVHQRMSNCRAQGNEPCEHLLKYLTVLRKVNDMSGQKHALKLHIEKIGELLQESLKKPQKKQLQNTKSTQKLQNFLQKTSQSNYQKGHLTFLDQSLQNQRDRILPIITTTASAYYKPKSKQFNLK